MLTLELCQLLRGENTRGDQQPTLRWKGSYLETTKWAPLDFNSYFSVSAADVGNPSDYAQHN
jgi:hypothetical protein